MLALCEILLFNPRVNQNAVELATRECVSESQMTINGYKGTLTL